MLLQTSHIPLDQLVGNTFLSAESLITSIRTNLPQTLAIYIFGSQAQGPNTAGPHSDLDVAVLVPTYADPQQLWTLAGELAELAACHVDLLDLRAASTVMQHQVLSTGQRLWGIEPAAGLFECFVLSEKIALDTARAGLLHDIAKEGKIHG